MHLELLESRVANARIVAMVAASGGAKDVNIPDFDEARVDFDKWLEAEPKTSTADSEMRELMNAMGVG